MADADIDMLFRDRRINAGIAWLLVGFLGVIAVVELVDGEFLWAGFAATVCVLSLLPIVAYRSAEVMLPWEVVAVAALPVLGRTVATVPVTGNLATYLSVAAVALIIAVQLQVFTSVEMTYGFAILFVVVTTMAAAGTWAVVRWAADIQLGTGFLVGYEDPEYALMIEFVYSFVVGIVAGVVFELYFRRRVDTHERLPEEVAEGVQ
ncbi:hypothetical protein [Halostella pelagica]|uniref:hypothetical protein n=1 Tax=Halostella pelagica TaxID=2583824 RepID=UPI0010801D8B|nr:hypothetical protein [Halostella pelagica]